MPDPTPPRRRIADRDRRRWSDPALDQLSERVEAADDRFAALDRRISEVRTDLAQSNERLGRIERTLNESFERNFREHREVKNTADKIAANVAPTRWSKVKDFATFISVLIVPFLLTYLTIVLAGGTR